MFIKDIYVKIVSDKAKNEIAEDLSEEQKAEFEKNKMSSASTTCNDTISLLVENTPFTEHELEKLNTFRVKEEQYWQERKQLSWN